MFLYYIKTTRVYDAIQKLNATETFLPVVKVTPQVYVPYIVVSPPVSREVTVTGPIVLTSGADVEWMPDTFTPDTRHQTPGFGVADFTSTAKDARCHCSWDLAHALSAFKNK